MSREFIVPENDIGCDGEMLGYKVLVRCKECKYSGYLWGNIFCKHFADEMSVQITEDDYCSRGERGANDS